MNERDVLTLTHDRLDVPIEIRCGHPTVLYVESAEEFYRLVGELLAQYNGGKGEFSLFRNGELTTVSGTLEIVSDIFSMDLNDSKTVNALYKELMTLSQNSDLSPLQSEINAKIAQFYESLFDRFSVSLTYDAPELSDLIKLGNIKLAEESNDLLEKTVDFIDAVVNIKRKSAFVFVNLKKSMSDEKIVDLYKHCELEKVGLLLIEGRSQCNKLKDETVVTVTEDLCELIDTGQIIVI